MHSENIQVLILTILYTLRVGNNVSQVTRMAHFILRGPMCQIIWVEMWPYLDEITFSSDNKTNISQQHKTKVLVIFAIANI